MSRLEAALRGLLGHLVERGVAFAVVGGVAVSVRAEPRFTRDADICVAVESDAQSEDLVTSLRTPGYLVTSLMEQADARRLAAARLERPTSDEAGVALDLLFASSGIEAEVVAAAEPLELFEGLVAPVATVPCLIALKVLARDDATRPQDRVDLVALRRLATAADMEEARRLLLLISDRGYHRGRALVADLEAFEQEMDGR
jgi:predicted nucleotidyltransferase